MSTSGTYTFSVNSYQIVRQAMLDIVALDGLEQPTPEEYTDCLFKLNMLAKQWMGRQDFAPGMKVWTRRRGTLFLGYSQYAYNLGFTGGSHWAASVTGLPYPPNNYNATTGSGAGGSNSLICASVANMTIGDQIGVLVGSDLQWTTITGVNTGTLTVSTLANLSAGVSGAQVFNYSVQAQRPEVIIACVLRDIYANDTPLRLMTVEEYESLPTKAMPTFQSDPAGILYETLYTTQNPNGTLYLDCGGAQDPTKVLHLTFLQPVQDFNNPGDSPDYPQRWYQPLVLELGKLIAPMFDCIWTTTLEELRKSALSIAQEGDPEQTAAYFEVDSSDPYGP